MLASVDSKLMHLRVKFGLMESIMGSKSGLMASILA
jgi:hypothetical protein